MSQTVVDFSGDPSGVQLLDNLLTPMKTNILTSNSGTSRPSYAQAGTAWTDTTSTPWVQKYFDGTDDIILGYINATTNVFTPVGGILNNFAATANPTVNEDSGDGYSVGSVWINTTLDRAYVNVDSTIGAAVWKFTSLQTSDLGTVALLNSIANSNMATMAANTVKANATGSSATPTDVALTTSQLLGVGATGNIAAITMGNGMSMVTTALTAQFWQKIRSLINASATGATAMPYDDTIPQITEGVEFHTVTITPKTSTSKLTIDESLTCSHSVSTTNVSVALFQDATANALAATSVSIYSGGAALAIPLRHTMTSGTTSSTVLRLRAGGATGATLTVNGSAGTRIFGGVASSLLTVEETAT